MDEWNTYILRPLDGKDVSPFCCAQVACCLPCVWGSALRAAGIEDSLLLTLLVICGGDTLCDEGAGYIARRRILRKYSIKENEFETIFKTCFCAPCARFQELNTILERENLTYGYLEVVPDAKPPPPKAPANARIVRDPTVRGFRL